MILVLPKLNRHSYELKKLFLEPKLSLKGEVRISFGYYSWISIMTYYTKVTND